MEILFFPDDVAFITAAYTILLRLIVVCFFASADLLFQGWDPGPDAHRPSTRRQRRSRPRHSPYVHRWNPGTSAHLPSVHRHLRRRRKRSPPPPYTSILLRLIVVFFRPVHRLPWHDPAATSAASYVTSYVASSVAASAASSVAQCISILLRLIVVSLRPSEAASATPDVAPSVAASATPDDAPTVAIVNSTTVIQFRDSRKTVSLEESPQPPFFRQRFRPTSLESTPVVPRRQLHARTLLFERIVIYDDGTASEGDSAAEGVDNNVAPALVLPSREDINNKDSEPTRGRHWPLEADASASHATRSHPPAAVTTSHSPPTIDDEQLREQVKLPKTAREGDSSNSSSKRARLGPHDDASSASHADKHRHSPTDDIELPITACEGEKVTISRSCEQACHGPLEDKTSSQGPPDNYSKNNRLTSRSQAIAVLCWCSRLFHLPSKIKKTMAEEDPLPKRTESARDPSFADYLHVESLFLIHTSKSTTKSRSHICVDTSSESYSSFESESTEQLNGIFDTDFDQQLLIFGNHHSELNVFECYAEAQVVDPEVYHCSFIVDNAYRYNQSYFYQDAKSTFLNGDTTKFAREAPPTACTYLLHEKAKVKEVVEVSKYQQAVAPVVLVLPVLVPQEVFEVSAYQQAVAPAVLVLPVPQQEGRIARVHSLTTATVSYHAQVYNDDLFVPTSRNRRSDQINPPSLQDGTSTDGTSNSTSASSASSTRCFSTNPQVSAIQAPSLYFNSASTVSLESVSTLSIFTSESESSFAPSESVSPPSLHQTPQPTPRPAAIPAPSRPNVSFRGRKQKKSPKQRESVEQGELKLSIIAPKSTLDMQHDLPISGHQENNLSFSTAFLPAIVVNVKHIVETIIGITSANQTSSTNSSSPFAPVTEATGVAVLNLASGPMKLLLWFYYVSFILACDSYFIYYDSRNRRETSEVGTITLRVPTNRIIFFADVVFSGSWLQVYDVPGTPVIYKSRFDSMLTSSDIRHSYEFYFKYRSVIENIKFLAQRTRRDIILEVRQCVRFQEYLNRSTRQLKGTPNIDLAFLLNSVKYFERYGYQDFSGNWPKKISATVTPITKSRSGCIVTYAACTIHCPSKLKAKCITTSTSAHTATYLALPSSALKITCLPTMLPRTKASSMIICHRFREYVRTSMGLIKMRTISTDDQVANIFTKPLTQDTFVRHRVQICGSKIPSFNSPRLVLEGV